MKEFAKWFGVDIDLNAIKIANTNGVPCVQMDMLVAINFVDQAFDIVMMTETLGHLPYPQITIKEVYRILKKGIGSGYFLDSVPIDYHLHRRFSVMKGRRL